MFTAAVTTADSDPSKLYRVKVFLGALCNDVRQAN
jgi:hypothetical protein